MFLKVVNCTLTMLVHRRESSNEWFFSSSIDHNTNIFFAVLNIFIETGKFNISALLDTLEYFPFIFISVAGWIFYHKDRY